MGLDASVDRFVGNVVWVLRSTAGAGMACRRASAEALRHLGLGSIASLPPLVSTLAISDVVAWDALRSHGTSTMRSGSFSLFACRARSTSTPRPATSIFFWAPTNLWIMRKGGRSFVRPQALVASQRFRVHLRTAPLLHDPHPRALRILASTSATAPSRSRITIAASSRSTRYPARASARSRRASARCR